MEFVDLFCGAGGLGLGFSAHFSLAWASDWDQAAVQTHRLNCNSRCERTDLGISLETMGPRLRGVDVVVGGPPCQGFSSAGLRKEGDGRNTLVAAFADWVVTLRPRAFVFENVEGFLTAEGGRRVLELLTPVIGAGYRVRVRKMNAANYGVPQHRKRVMVVGGLGWEPSLPEPTHNAFGAPGAVWVDSSLPSAPTVANALAGLPPPAADPPGAPQGHVTRPLSHVDLARARALAPGQTMRDLPEALHHGSYARRAYRRVMDGTPTDKRGGAPAGLRRLVADQPSKAITSGATSEFLHPTDDRNLTIRECARIQTFPDDFVFCGSTAEQVRLIGNAVPPVLARAVAGRLRSELEVAGCDTNLPGCLLSFDATPAEGMSPALRKVTAAVEEVFGMVAIHRQLPLWR